MFWERQSTTERADTLREIQQTLRNHHRNYPGPQAHPAGGFLVPEWSGTITLPGVASLGHAPSWAL
jgi:hypothetical protein